MSDSDKQALLNGTATIKTEIQIIGDNLFDKNNANTFNATIGNIDTLSGGSNKVLYISCKPNTTYTIQKRNDGDTNRFRVATSIDTPIVGVNVYQKITDKDDARTITITTNSTTQYLIVQYYREAETILTEQDLLDSIRIEEGTPIILTEDNSIISWDHEDFRYVKDEGFIGQFVGRQLTGELKNITNDFTITDKELELRLGIKINNSTNWYSLGNFLVTKVTDNEVDDKTSFEALDYTKLFNKTYEDTITYPCTALQLAQNVCNQCNVELATTNFLNYNYNITGNAFTNGESCRDVMKAIGKLAFSWVRVDWDNKVYIDFEKPTIVDTYDKADNSKYYKLTTQKEIFGQVNKIIIGYSQIDGERTYIEDAESIVENGLCELTIYDNPLVYTQAQRESIINNASGLLGLTYTPLNVQTVGHPWLKGKELFEVTDMENNKHYTIPFDRTIQYFGHIKTVIDVDTETKTNTEYAYPSNLETNLKRTEVRVNKIDGEITSVIEDVNEQNSKISYITQTVDEINQKISDIADVTVSGESNVGNVPLDNINASEPITLKIHPIGENISYLYPNSSLYPSSTLYSKTRTIRFIRTYQEEGQTLTQNIDYELPDDLLYYDSTHYDEFYLSYDSQTCQVTKKCKYNADGTVGLLSQEQIDTYIYPTIALGDGDYEIQLLGYNIGYLYVQLMASNIYTTQFATRVEMNSVINQTAEEINLEVSKKVGNDEVISKINQSAEQISINADKISLAGKTIQLTSDNIAITSTNFNVDDNGNMSCTNANVNGTITSADGTIGGWTINNLGLTNGVVKLNSDGSSTIYTVADLFVMKGYIMGIQPFDTMSAQMLSHYDLNNDGRVDASDYVILQQLIGISM